MLNLINNAFKFTQNGSITLKIKPKNSVVSDNNLIEFKVKDSGKGISNEVLKQLED